MEHIVDRLFTRSMFVKNFSNANNSLQISLHSILKKWAKRTKQQMLFNALTSSDFPSKIFSFNDHFAALIESLSKHSNGAGTWKSGIPSDLTTMTFNDIAFVPGKDTYALVWKFEKEFKMLKPEDTKAVLFNKSDLKNFVDSSDVSDVLFFSYKKANNKTVSNSTESKKQISGLSEESLSRSKISSYNKGFNKVIPMTYVSQGRDATGCLRASTKMINGFFNKEVLPPRGDTSQAHCIIDRYGMQYPGDKKNKTTVRVNTRAMYAALLYIHNCLDRKRPVLAGINYKLIPIRNNDDVTDHFIVINGYGKDSYGEYLTILDPADKYTEHHLVKMYVHDGADKKGVYPMSEASDQKDSKCYKDNYQLTQIRVYTDDNFEQITGMKQITAEQLPR
ncbi:MAG: hypothetical protein MJZ34_02775 [Paludibacteraceae bacterium]|nr:hypothetical protein [Paludibacteraceae bacterium]